MGTVDPMNANEMLDYALGQLDGPAREQFERELAADPRQAVRAERVTLAVHLLLDDGDPHDPPDGLVHRTVVYTAEAAERRRSILDFVPVAVPFRWADVAVAAGIFLAGLLTLLPAVQRSRERMSTAGCTYNLQQLGQALWMYGNSHRHYPFGPEQNRSAPTGSFASMLQDEGYLSDPSVLDCPSNGPCAAHPPLPRFDEICDLQQTDPDRVRATLVGDYAYNVSYKHRSGRVEPIEAVHSPLIPLLADQPDHEAARRIRPGNSPNHGGRGQNVLFSDLHVNWHNTRQIHPIDDDMFLNEDQELAPGKHEGDAVLCPSLVPFVGWGQR
jgi:hypothetical protein